MDVFIPSATTTRTVSSSTANVALPSGPQFSRTVALYHSAGADVFVKFGVGSSTTAAVTDFPVPSGQMIRVQIPDGATYVAAITASATGTLYITVGAGG